MTKKEKAEEIVRQDGGCRRIYCDYNRINECPAHAYCKGASQINVYPCQGKLTAAGAYLGTITEKEPSVWDGAPEWAVEATVYWKSRDNKYVSAWSKIYTRELPKTKARKIAEKYSGDTERMHPMIDGKRAVDVIEQAINEALGSDK